MTKPYVYGHPVPEAIAGALMGLQMTPRDRVRAADGISRRGSGHRAVRARRRRGTRLHRLVVHGGARAASHARGADLDGAEHHAAQGRVAAQRLLISPAYSGK